MGIGSPSLSAAFGSKEALYAEALRHSSDSTDAIVWGKFHRAATAREAVCACLQDSAAALSGEREGLPRGCMVTLSSVDSQGHPELDALVRSSRAVAFERLTARLEQAVSAGEFPASVDVPSLARFVQTVQSGLSILARDGAAGLRWPAWSRSRCWAGTRAPEIAD